MIAKEFCTWAVVYVKIYSDLENKDGLNGLNEISTKFEFRWKLVGEMGPWAKPNELYQLYS